MFEVVIRRDGADLETKQADTLKKAKAIGDQAIASGKADSVRVNDVECGRAEVTSKNLDHSWVR